MGQWRSVLKGWQLFLIITALFFCSYYVVNRRYDKFYRINDINNDNRVIIEKYLSDADQKYLVENQVPITDLIGYMHYKGFNIRNYKYYQWLIDEGRYSGAALINYGNAMAKKINTDFSSNQDTYAQNIINNQMVEGYINVKSFNYRHLTEYKIVKPLYSDTGYVDATENDITLLSERGLTTNEIRSFLTTACRHYNAAALSVLMSKASDRAIQLISDPTSNTLTLDGTEFIGSYAPDSLVLAQNILRFKYDMYLQNDAYQALVEMRAAMGTLAKRLVLKEAYVAYSDNTENTAGFTEEQLGTMIIFTHSSLGYDRFSESDQSKWLEANAYKYGFVIRYQHDKASYTNHNYDAHIYRYVGKKLAKELHDKNMCLEEYNENAGGEGD